MSANLLDGHNILINIMPNNDKLPAVVVGMIVACVIGYLGVKCLLAWWALKERHMVGSVVVEELLRK